MCNSLKLHATSSDFGVQVGWSKCLSTMFWPSIITSNILSKILSNENEKLVFPENTMYLVALNLLVNNQLNSLLRQIIVTKARIDHSYGTVAWKPPDATNQPKRKGINSLCPDKMRHFSFLLDLFLTKNVDVREPWSETREHLANLFMFQARCQSHNSWVFLLLCQLWIVNYYVKLVK